MDLEKLIVDAFEEVKNGYYRPPIGGPKIIKEDIPLSGSGTAFFSFLTREVVVNQSFLEKLSKRGMKFEALAKGLISHEMGHYMLHPKELSLSLFLSYKTEQFFKEAGRAKQRSIYSIYLDFQDNNLVIREDIFSKELQETLTAVVTDPAICPLARALFETYRVKYKFPDISIWPELPKDKESKVSEAVKELDKIVVSGSMDYGLQLSQLKRLGDIILPFLDEESRENCSGSGENGYMPSSRANKLITPQDVDELPVELRREIEKAIDSLIKKLPRGDYEAIRRHFLGNERLSGRGSGIGSSKTEMEIARKETIEYYKTLAREHNGIVICPRRMSTLKLERVPHGFKEFQPSDFPQKIDLRFSGGYILPGLTKTQRNYKIIMPSSEEKLPTLVLRKDASGSMPNPMTEKCYATAAGTMLVLSYLRSGAPVVVSLFDSETTEPKRSRNENELLEILCGYKGGGTELDLNKMKEDLRKMGEVFFDDNYLSRHHLARNYLKKNAILKMREKNKEKGLVDLVIITDGGISNIEEIVSFIKENPNYRPVILHSSDFELALQGYDQKTSGIYEGIQVYKIESPEDYLLFSKRILHKNLLPPKRTPISGGYK